jgi:signal transduction histidine kinase
MSSVFSASGGLVVNLLAFFTGALLYGMLVALVWRERAAEGASLWASRGRLPLLTGVAGLVWNAGGLLAYSLSSYAGTAPSPWINAVAFGALGLLPACVVHSLLESRERVGSVGITRSVTMLGYGIAGIAAILHLHAAAIGAPIPPRSAVWLLTGGFITLTLLVLLITRGGPVARRSVWVVTLSTFAVSALHFEQHGGGSWWVELLGHHTSLLLALAILHQDYRFAFADLFLKRALAWVAMIGLSTVALSIGIVPLLRWQDAAGAVDPRAIALAVGLWAATAWCFPALQRVVDRLVDRTMLRRSDYRSTRTTLSQALDRASTEGEVQAIVAATLATTLGATHARWVPDPLPPTDLRLVFAGTGAETWLPDTGGFTRLDTAESPRMAVALGALRDGRRLLSDDLDLLDAVARLAGRRINALRADDARRLATEAELRALRAQLNPHFLFNALTTIGYLITTAPPRALDTLLRLTNVLRAVLRQSHIEFVPLRDELALVQDYLDIERARFEERLDVTHTIDDGALTAPVPAFILQPLVENAIKHGIAPLSRGGRVFVVATLDDEWLVLDVEDTGAGLSTTSPSTGVGLSNVRRRLAAHYGTAASLTLTARPGGGTRVRLRIPRQQEPHVSRPTPHPDR